MLLDPRRASVVARFDEPLALERVLECGLDWIGDCAALMISFALGRNLRERLESAGFTEWRSFATAAGGLHVGTPVPPRMPRDAAPGPPRRPPLETLVIVDPCLGADRGHYLQHATLLSAGAQANGARIVWAAQEGLSAADTPANAKVIPCFRRSFIDLHKDGFPEFDLSDEIAESWMRFADSVDSTSVQFLIHSADGHLLRAADRLLRERPNLRAAVHLVMHVEPRRLAGRALHEEVHRTLIRIRRSPAWERNLFLWAENQPLAAWISQWLQADVPVPPALIGAPTKSVRRNEDFLHLAFLGEARASKGFFDLPAIADAIASDGDLSRSIRLFVQWCPPLGRELRQHEEALERLRRFSFVQIATGMLTKEQYDRQLANMDVCLLPYDPELYRLRGSGVLLEALAQGAALIVRTGSALVDTAAQGLAFEYRRPADLPQILRRLLSTRSQTRVLAERRAQRFLNLNGAERFLKALDRRSRQLAQFS